jgi:hypothetical protein
MIAVLFANGPTARQASPRTTRVTQCLLRLFNTDLYAGEISLSRAVMVRSNLGQALK